MITSCNIRPKMRLCYMGGSTRTPTYDYNKLTASFDQMLLTGGFLLNEDGTLNASQMIPLPPPPSNYLYAVFKAATTTRTPLAPVFSFVPSMGGSQINTALSTPSIAAATYAAIIQVMRAFSTFTLANADGVTSLRALCGGVSLDFENDTNVWISSYNTWVVGLRQALVAAGLPGYISNYISPRYDSSISTSVWQQAVTATDMTILPAYIGTPPGPGGAKVPGPRDPWPYVHDRITNLVNRIGKALLGKITYATPYYSDRNVCSSSTPQSANLYQGVPGNWVQYRDCLDAATVPGAIVTDVTQYGCQCVVSPVSASQYSAMMAAGQLPVDTQLPLWYQYYYNDLEVMRSRVSALMAEGWTNITLWCGGYEGDGRQPIDAAGGGGFDRSDYIDVLTAFPTSKVYADGILGAVSARLGYPLMVGENPDLEAGGEPVAWVLTPTVLTCYGVETYAPLFQTELTGCREISTAPNPTDPISGGGVVLLLRSDGKIVKMSRYGAVMATFTAKTAGGVTLNIEHIDSDALNNVGTQLYATAGLRMYLLDISGVGTSTASVVDSFDISSCVKVARFQVCGDRFCIVDAGESNYPKIMVRLGTHTFMTALVKASTSDIALGTTLFYLMCTDGTVRTFTIDTAVQTSSSVVVNGKLIDVRDGAGGMKLIVTKQSMMIAPTE